MNKSGLVIERTIERKNDIRNATPLRATVERKLGDVAGRLSRRNVITARCELCNEALHTLVDLCYETDDDGQLCNVDPITGQILVPMPCGWRKCSAYGLRRPEADVIRFALLHWQRTERFPLFEFIKWTTRWYINLDPYSNPQAARSWLDEHPITPRLWNAATNKGA